MARVQGFASQPPDPETCFAGARRIASGRDPCEVGHSRTRNVTSVTRVTVAWQYKWQYACDQKYLIHSCERLPHSIAQSHNVRLESCTGASEFALLQTSLAL